MIPSSFKRNLIALALSAIVATGCGGGGNTTSTSTHPDSLIPTTIGGAAAKGIVSSGIITAYELNTQGVKGDAVGSTTTDADGSYSLTLDAAYDGTSALLIELTANATTLMVCDALNGCGDTARGDTFTLPTDFTLRAILPAATAGSIVSAQVTSFTDMAAEIITTNADASEAAIQAAITKVTQLVGVNIMETRPVDITKNINGESIAAQHYALMLAAIASLAFQDADGDGDIDADDMQINLQNFSNDFADGQLGNDTNGLKPADLVQAVNNELDNDDNKNNLSEDARISVQQTNDLFEININDEGNSPSTEPTNTPSTDIAKAKALVTETRTWITALGNLKTPAQAFGTEAETLTQTFDTNAQAILEVIGQIIFVVDEAIANARNTQQAIPESVTVEGKIVTITNNSVTGTTNLTIATPDSGIAGVHVTFTVNSTHDLDSSTIEAGKQTLKVSGEASNHSAKIVLTETIAIVDLASQLTLERNADPDVTALTISGGMSITKLSNGFPTGDEIEGKTDIKLVKLTTAGGSAIDNIRLSLEKIAFKDMKITNSKGEYAGLSVVLNVNNAATFDTFAFLNNKSIIKHSTHDKNSETLTFDPTEIANTLGITTIYNACYGTDCAGSYHTPKRTCVKGLDASQQVILNCIEGENASLEQQFKDLYPQSHIDSILIRQVYYHYHGVIGKDDVYLASNADIRLVDMESASNFLQASLSITGEIKLDDYPKATAALTLSRTGLETGDVVLTIAHNQQSVTLFYHEKTSDSDATLIITNPAGVKLELTATENATKGTVSINGTTIGTLEELKDTNTIIIRYNDGTFESL
jgi:uncharacterized protein (DUF2141 family)